jgi:phosphoglycerol geranylgeranyltransferase
MRKIYTSILSAHKKKRAQLAVLIDPDKFNPALIDMANQCKVSFFFVGGSEIKTGSIAETIAAIKQKSQIPVVIFPGDEKQLSARADAVLFLSLLSGRNPEYLIGKQVLAAPFIKKNKLECISTAYLLIDGTNRSSVQKVSKTRPLMKTDWRLIVDTAIAGQLLGFRLIYLEAESGAKENINTFIIKKVKENIEIPLIIGGGIGSVKKTKNAISAGADIIVVGNALEKDILLLKKLSSLF